MENSQAINSNRFRYAIEQSPASIAIFDLQTALVTCSQQWREDLGWDGTPVEGQRYSYLVPQAPHQWNDAYQTALRGQSARCEAHLLVRADDTQQWIQGKFNPWYDETGELCGVLWMTEALSEQEGDDFSWNRVLQLSPDLYCIAGFDGYFKRLNLAWEKVLGYTLSDLKAKPFIEFVHPDDRGQTLTCARSLTDGGIVQTFENRYRCRDGSHRWLQWTSVSVVERQLSYAIARDMTDRKKTELVLRENEAKLQQQTVDLTRTLQELRQTQMQLVQTEKMSSLGQLIAGVAHEINNPVNFIYGNLVHAKEYTEDILGLLELYQEFYQQPAPEIQEEAESIDLEFLVDDLPQLLSSMTVGANRIKEIVASLRNFSRMDEVEMTRVDLHEGIDSTLTILQNRLKAKHTRPEIEIVKEYGELPKVQCFAGQINQVFMNIISNAVDALEERDKDRTYREIEKNPSAIRICTLQPDPDTIAIRIIDNGPGISDDLIGQLFDPFFTTKPMGKGTGLGLSISYQIITEKHGGTLSCRSAVGEGTEFSISIPVEHEREDEPSE
ncbi:MAG: PAS domain S-box protein [Cyanobacteria bacterium SID2]|nr:PAS domain S-box protein [Cyanobacteria bacterium SID2]